MTRSFRDPEPVLDPAIRKQITITKLIGIPLTLALFVVGCFSLLTGNPPVRIGYIALVAEGVVGAAVLGRILSLKKSARRS